MWKKSRIGPFLGMLLACMLAFFALPALAAEDAGIVSEDAVRPMTLCNDFSPWRCWNHNYRPTGSKLSVQEFINLSGCPVLDKKGKVIDVVEVKNWNKHSCKALWVPAPDIAFKVPKGKSPPNTLTVTPTTEGSAVYRVTKASYVPPALPLIQKAVVQPDPKALVASLPIQDRFMEEEKTKGVVLAIAVAAFIAILGFLAGLLLRRSPKKDEPSVFERKTPSLDERHSAHEECTHACGQKKGFAHGVGAETGS